MITDELTPAVMCADETSHISYAVLDKDGETITTITRKFVVTQAVSFVFDSGSVTADGAVVVVKRSTDPVRINNSSFSVETAGIAAGAYRLVSDKTKFHLNNMTSLAASLPLGSSGNFEIYGDYPSSSMFDAVLSLKTVEGTTLCTTNITVLWVDISMRCGQDEPFSADNGMTAHSQDPSNDRLARGSEPNGNDIMRPDFSDSDPSPNGRVFDVDTPGLHPGWVSTYPTGNTFATRMNFAQYTCFGSRRCSDDFLWHTRTTVVRTNSMDTLPFVFFTRPDRPDDNSAGTGSTVIDR